MDLKKLQTVVVAALEDIKAQDIRIFDTSHLTSLFDRIAIASGTSNRQTKALAASVRDKVKEQGGTVISIEGEATGEWVLVDLGDIIVHIMQPTIRDYYRLEEIWGEKEIKVGAAKRISKRMATEPMDDPAPPKKAVRGVAVTQALADEEQKKTVRKTTRSASTRSAKIPAGKTVKVAATKSAAVKKPVAKRASTAKTKAAN